MNAHERLRRRLRGEEVDCPPNLDILMTFAAHFIRQPLSRYYLDYRVLVAANLAVMERFAIDIVQAISDPYREAADWGLEVEFPEDGLPVAKAPLLTDLDAGGLKAPDPGSGRRMSDRLEAVRLLRAKVQDDVPVMGWVEGALAEAGDLRGHGQLLLDLYDRPDELRSLLETCADVSVAFAEAQVAAGAHMIGLGDAIASQISPRMYREFALPYEQRVFDAVHRLGALARLHICGNTGKILPEMAESGADIIDLDWMVDLGAAAAAFGDRAAVCGNFDPVAIMLQGAPEQVYAATHACLQQGGPRSLSAAGCEIPDGTPLANLDAQTRALQDWAHLRAWPSKTGLQCLEQDKWEDRR